MRKKIGILIFSIILLCTGCGWNENESINSEGIEPSPLSGVIEDVPVVAGNQIPYWAQGIQMKGKLFQKLNLDGIGDMDDEVYVSTYQFGDYEDKITVLQVHLGTGETMAKIFPVYGDYSFKTGKLFSEDKDAIILEVGVPASNYNATNLFVLDIYPVGVDPIPEIAVRLDTTIAQNILFMGDPILDAGSTYVTGATEFVDIKDLPLQGLKVTIIDPTDQHQQREKILYWKDGEWSFLVE